VLIKGPAVPVRRHPAPPNTRAAADAGERLLVPEQRLHVTEVAERFPEWRTAHRVVDGELEMGNAVEGDTHTVFWVASTESALTCPPGIGHPSSTCNRPASAAFSVQQAASQEKKEDGKWRSVAAHRRSQHPLAARGFHTERLCPRETNADERPGLR
jgi:hypothetical protein